jgi:hypothetical protein
LNKDLETKKEKRNEKEKKERKRKKKLATDYQLERPSPNSISDQQQDTVKKVSLYSKLIFSMFNPKQVIFFNLLVAQAYLI